MKFSWSALETEAEYVPEIPVTINKFVGRDCVVGIATRYRLDGKGLEPL